MDSSRETATTLDSSKLSSSMPTDLERERLQVLIDPDLKTELRVEAAKRGQTMAEVLDSIIRAWLAEGRRS